MIFLSASIPYLERDKKYIETADVIAIRDSVRALATVVIPNTVLVWGGHPAITPLIRYVMMRMNPNENIGAHVTLYQSDFFSQIFPKDNGDFERVIITPRLDDREESLALMRREMIERNEFSAGIFIGGMDGVEEEYEMFVKVHPKALALPIASTGAAARIIYNSIPNPDKRLLNEYAYMSLFKSLLKNQL